MSDPERVQRFKRQIAPLLANIPNYTCLESMSQSVVDARGRKADIDLVRVDVAISGKKEIYEWAGSRTFSDRSLASTLRNGFSTIGIFSDLARGLIGTDTSHIRFIREESLGDERVYRYSFRVPAQTGVWWIRSESQDGLEVGGAGEEGFFWVDAGDLTLRRIDVSAIDIPTKVRVKMLRSVVDYERMSIGDRRVLLPSDAIVKVNLKDLDKELDSEIVFNHCRAFSAESTLSFGDAPQSDLNAETRMDLPNRLLVPVELLSPITPSGADRSDILKANVPRSVQYSGKEVILKGALVEGHVFRRRIDGGFAIEIDRVNTVRGWQSFYARLISFGDTAIPAQGKSRTIHAPTSTPGVATINITSGLEFAAGTQMLWITEPLDRQITFVQNQRNCQMCFGPSPFQ